MKSFPGDFPDCELFAVDDFYCLGHLDFPLRFDDLLSHITADYARQKCIHTKEKASDLNDQLAFDELLYNFVGERRVEPVQK